MKDPMLFNKLAFSGLVALLLFFGLPQLATAIRGGEHRIHKEATGHPFPQYPIPFETEGAAPGEEAPADLGTLLAAADPKAGERRAALCKSCHTFEKGGANGTGPNLWDIVGRPLAAHPGFKYTPALQSAGGEWTFERLDAFIANSQGYIPGTAMVQRFANPAQRADILSYLRTLSDSPVDPPPPATPQGAAAQVESPEEAGASEPGAGTVAAGATSGRETTPEEERQPEPQPH
jgi:cytochrome c